MIHFGWAIAALFFGGFIGFFTAGLCCAAGREDERRLRDIDSINGKDIDR